MQIDHSDQSETDLNQAGAARMDTQPEKPIQASQLTTATTAFVPMPVECPVKEALRFLAGAWTIEIFWHLRSGPARFGELQRRLAGVSAKVLATRLRELEEIGVISRKVYPTIPPAVEYALTPLGKRFDPVLAAISEVGKGLNKPSKKTKKRQ